jgi:hypothetical protein
MLPEQLHSTTGEGFPLVFPRTEVINNVYKELELRRPGEQAIIFDPETGAILFADLLLDGKTLEDGANIQELIDPPEGPFFGS